MHGQANNKLIYINIENSGFGTAKNIRFEVTKNINNYQGEYFDISTKEIFKNGIKRFYPKQKFRYFLLNINKDNYEKIILDILEISVSFQDITGKHYKSYFSLPVKEMMGVGSAVPPDDYLGRIPYYLDKLNRTLSDVKKSIENIENVNRKSDES